MQKIGLLLLRISMGDLMVWWGVDKLFNVEHSVGVSESFYLGVGANALFLNAFGVAQAILGALVIVGKYRRFTYPVMFLITLGTALSVWQSILDPWGWVFEGANVLFYPSLIILGASMTLWGSMSSDTLSMDEHSG